MKTEGIPQRVRWILQPGQREYIEDLLIEISQHMREINYYLAFEDIYRQLEKIETELFCLLPEIAFADQAEHIRHPLGFRMSVDITRSPRCLAALASSLERISSRYSSLRYEHGFKFHYDGGFVTRLIKDA